MTICKKLVAVKLALAAAALLGSTAGIAPVSAWADGFNDDHSRYHQSPRKSIRTAENYTIPAVTLVRDDGKTVSLAQELDDRRPVVLNFIFTTCTSICPLSSRTFQELQDKLGADRNKVHLVSISIDPEQDTPARLTEYARKFEAGPSWQHYTGKLAEIIATQRAFGVYRGNKMGHAPLTLVRTAPGKPWVKIDGYATADELANELRDALPGQAVADNVHQIRANDSRSVSKNPY